MNIYLLAVTIGNEKTRTIVKYSLNNAFICHLALSTENSSGDSCQFFSRSGTFTFEIETNTKRIILFRNIERALSVHSEIW